MKTIGILAHSAEGGALCFITACRYAATLLGEHMHPTIVVSAIPMALSMEGWNSDNHLAVAKHLIAGIRTLATAGADFFICPDNTAHIVLEKHSAEFPIPGLHIADVACRTIQQHGCSSVGLLGTEWTMTGPVYANTMARHGQSRMIPDEPGRSRIHEAIFDELCQGIFREETTAAFLREIENLRADGAECVILGCTEIPLIIHEGNSCLPVVDTTRLLASRAVDLALRPAEFETQNGWIRVS